MVRRQDGQQLRVEVRLSFFLHGHGIDQLANSLGFVVVSDDSICDLSETPDTGVLNQWTYHARLYNAAQVIAERDDLELIQLNSFGCGLDAVTTDEVEEICRNNNKLYTVLKIDEGSSLGAARIRVRSLKAAISERTENNILPEANNRKYQRKLFTKKMKDEYTLMIPQMSPIHFRHVATATAVCGYRCVELPPVNVHAVD